MRTVERELYRKLTYVIVARLGSSSGEIKIVFSFFFFSLIEFQNRIIFFVNRFTELCIRGREDILKSMVRDRRFVRDIKKKKTIVFTSDDCVHQSSANLFR